MNRLIASLFVAATIIAAVLPPATQADEKKIVILFSFVATSATHFVGNYSMQGAIYEAGAAEGDSTFYPTGNGGIQDRGDKVLHLTGGDIFMHFESEVEFVGPTALIERGTWTLTGGTGIYEHIKGHGKNFILGDGVGGLFHRASTTARSTYPERPQPAPPALRDSRGGAGRPPTSFAGLVSRSNTPDDRRHPRLRSGRAVLCAIRLLGRTPSCLRREA